MVRSTRPVVLARLGCALLLLGVLTGCGSDPLAPFEPQVNNAPDTFQMQATGVQHVSLTRSYSWSNSGARATIDHSTTTSTGSAQLLIRDAAGTVVYDRALAPSLNEATAAGQTGTWTILVTLSNYTGTLNFRVQKL